MNKPEIEELKLLVEEKYGRALNTTTDFEEFSWKVERVTGHPLSASTLKRMWGYVNDSHKPRIFTLDILACYLGHKNFTEFVEWLKTSPRYNSSFFDAAQLISSKMVPGAVVEIGWSPNRLVRMTYLGESRYEVIEARNSKIRVGDRLLTGCFIKGQPLYLPYIERDGGTTPPFVAGRNGGLTIINLIEEQQ